MAAICVDICLAPCKGVRAPVRLTGQEPAMIAQTERNCIQIKSFLECMLIGGLRLPSPTSAAQMDPL
jgi:hypothetical protein